VRLALLPILRPRRLDVCCCGLSKTGTHSMAGLFANDRSEHHPDPEWRLRIAIAYLRREIDAACSVSSAEGTGCSGWRWSPPAWPAS